MTKSKTARTVHIRLDEDASKSVEVIAGLMKAWGQSPTYASAARFAILKVARDIQNQAF